MCGIIIFTMTARSPRRDAKAEALRAHGALHPRPQAVQAPLFASHDFFDPRDLVQVKYEMLRQVDVEGQPVARTADAFGCSRPTFYQTQAALLPGTFGPGPFRRAPRARHPGYREMHSRDGRASARSRTSGGNNGDRRSTSRQGRGRA